MKTKLILVPAVLISLAGCTETPFGVDAKHPHEGGAQYNAATLPAGDSTATVLQTSETSSADADNGGAIGSGNRNGGAIGSGN